MHTTDILWTEHFLFARLLDALEALAERRPPGSPSDLRLAGRLVRFFAELCDGLHQDKEERVLLPCLIGRIGRLRVPELEHLADGHRRERRVLDQLRYQVEEFTLEGGGDFDHFAARARAYVRMQRRHMCEENATLLPLARQLLTAEDDCAVRAGFRRLEREHDVAFEPEGLRLLGAAIAHLGDVPPSETTRGLTEQRSA